MQSLMHAHLPADIVLRHEQAADKPPIVVLQTYTLTLSHTNGGIGPCFRRLYAQARLAFGFSQTTCQHSLFVFSSVLACPLYRYARCPGLER